MFPLLHPWPAGRCCRPLASRRSCSPRVCCFASLWTITSGRRQRLLSAGRHHRQVIGSYIDKNGRKHKKQADPETPIMMRTLPVRTTVMMALIHGMQLFSGVHLCLQIKNGKARETESASEKSRAVDSAGCPCLALDADQGTRRLIFGFFHPIWR